MACELRLACHAVRFAGHGSGGLAWAYSEEEPKPMRGIQELRQDARGSSGCEYLGAHPLAGQGHEGSA
jgi:hypothetical protein